MIENIIGKLINIAYKHDEVPVAAIIVYKGKIVAKAINKRQKNNDTLGHAEILAIKKANKRLKTWNLSGCDMYVSLEPCTMCKKIIEESRIDNVYYYVLQKKKKIPKTKYILINNELSDYSSKVIHSFFEGKR